MSRTQTAGYTEVLPIVCMSFSSLAEDHDLYQIRLIAISLMLPFLAIKGQHQYMVLRGWLCIALWNIIFHLICRYLWFLSRTYHHFLNAARAVSREALSLQSNCSHIVAPTRLNIHLLLIF